MKQVGQYLIERLVSTGGMSTLYLGRHREMGRQVAVKQLHPHLARDGALVKRFEREARILGGLRHRNIVDIIDFFRHQDSYYIVLEYIEGCSLKELLAARSPLPVTAAAYIGVQVAQGLGYAHGRGVVHRDIKPANVMFTRDGVAKIADFGLAFAKEALGVTDPGTFFGTPAYLAPEQVRGEKGDARSDLFSFGVVLYEALSGSNPFAGGGPSECIDRVLRLRPPRLSDADGSIPPGIGALVSDLMEKDPERRHRSAVEAAARLEPYVFITGEGLSRLLADPRGYQTRREDQQALDRLARSERRSRAAGRYLAYAAAAAALAAAGVAAVRWGVPAARRTMARRAETPAVVRTDSATPAPVPAPIPAAGGRLGLSGTTGARVFLDGTPRGSIPLSLEGVAPGAHRVRAELDGYQPYEKSVSLRPGGSLDLSIDLAPAAMEAGYLGLTVSPWAEVYVDGRFIDRTPLSGPLRMAAGRRQLMLRHPNRREYSREIEIRPGDTLRLEVAMPQAWGYLAVSATPWAEIFIDGQRAGATPLAEPIRVSIGDHQVRLAGPGGREWIETVRIAEGETLGTKVDLR